MQEKKNIIILTGGLAGSSVLTSLFAAHGYWTGDDTFRKSDYDTFENRELIALNESMLQAAGFTDDWTMEFSEDYLGRIRAGLANFEQRPLEDFVRKCNANSPWIWKDPRLWLTIRQWQEFLDFSTTTFLVIQREILQAWISTTIRRQIQTLDYLRRYDDGVRGTIAEFIRSTGANHVNIMYEDLIVDPRRILTAINQAAGTSLTESDFRAVFRGKLYRKQHGVRNYLLAKAIYFKNYSLRYR